MTLKCIGSGSSGNSYALVDNDNKIFLLDLGLSKKEILKGIDFRISDVVGAVVTHCHKDHSKSVDDFVKSGISVYKPYVIEKNVYINRNGFIVKSFDLMGAEFAIPVIGYNFDRNDLNKIFEYCKEYLVNE